MSAQTSIHHSPSAVLFSLNENTRKILFFCCAVLCLTQLISPAVALFTGIAIAQCTGHPYPHLNQKTTQYLLQFSIVGLGFSMNAHSALLAGKEGIVFTVVSIICTFTWGYLLGRWFNIEKKSSYLISAGTAICGGSAIAAISPVIKAGEKPVSIALGCVFILNSVALIIFPYIGHALHLSQTQFGLWCAIAIHDTSSVVGAASKFGPHAMEVATTIKLARALWIIPVSFLSVFIFKGDAKAVNIPYFIGFFVVAIIANSYLPMANQFSSYIVIVAKASLTLTLFLIGAGLSRNMLMSVGFKPLLQGIILWVSISAAALYGILHWA